ncbi:hypothetical protein N7539_002274 [Penicillium diatomitis]|uniref:ATP-grasp domain-containing protein n=1 Tax=Penicillium diatomitis TaxID=2819901 RepID=A0A9X0BZ17_9EURO|nr:uncharacterized protein N7539_002274 [Penicillium diatomitis]KAJ5490707.1 hypothetical protein N7539_002274 [Penicillium diatomitis]
MEGKSTPFFYRHGPKNVLLIVLSLLCLPLSLTLTAIALLVGGRQGSQRSADAAPSGRRKTILVTGVSMTKGLTIARLLAQHTSHRVVAADTETIPYTSPGRYSCAIAKFYAIETPVNNKKSHYVQTLLNILKSEKVNLWISCSSVTDAIEDGEVLKTAQEMLGSSFKAVQFERDVVAKLHEKDLLIDYIRDLGLVIPESHRCTSVGQVEQLLGLSTRDGSGGRGEKRFILKPIGVDDKARAQMMTLLPLAHGGLAATSSYLKSLAISPERPFQLQQFINGSEYCTHSLVVRGRVKAFVSCPSSDLLMHYQALPPTAALNQKMLQFTQRVCDHEGKTFSGHLSFDFLVDGTGEDATLYPIECNPRAHTAVVLFRDTPAMAHAYLSVFEEDGDPSKSSTVSTPAAPVDDYYWIGHDLVTFLLSPVLALLCGAGSFSAVHKGLKTFSSHLLYWRDGTFAIWDPLPFLVLYHVYWPIRFGQSLFSGQQWSRINVSTTKMFEC